MKIKINLAAVAAFALMLGSCGSSVDSLIDDYVKAAEENDAVEMAKILEKINEKTNDGSTLTIEQTARITGAAMSELGSDALNLLKDVEENEVEDIDEEEIPSSSSSANWDSLLDDYESYVDKYISFYKKAMNGDMSAMSKYTELLEKAEALSDKLDDAEDEMSSAQLQRYLKITQKMTNGLF